MSEDRVTTRGDVSRQKKREQTQTVICIHTHGEIVRNTGVDFGLNTFESSNGAIILHASESGSINLVPVDTKEHDDVSKSYDEFKKSGAKSAPIFMQQKMAQLKADELRTEDRETEIDYLRMFGWKLKEYLPGEPIVEKIFKADPRFKGIYVLDAPEGGIPIGASIDIPDEGIFLSEIISANPEIEDFFIIDYSCSIIDDPSERTRRLLSRQAEGHGTTISEPIRPHMRDRFPPGRSKPGLGRFGQRGKPLSHFGGKRTRKKYYKRTRKHRFA